MGPGEPLWEGRGRRVHLPVAEEVADSRTDRVAGSVLHISAATGQHGSALACLEDAAFSFPSSRRWLESISP